jgi:PAS domain S-box-containing protein
MANAEGQFDLEAASTLWRAIIDDMPHMISVKDAETRNYLFCNPECEKVLGPNAVGRTNFDVLDPAVAERIEAEETALINSGGVAIVETTVTDRTGHNWTMRTKKFLVSAAEGRRYLITVSEDVSEKHERARQLDQAIQAAQAANSAKSSFVANMSHEIRTPLNGVLGMAQAMAAEDLPAEQRKRLEIIQQSGETLLVILNDILDFSKIEAGKLELEDGEFDLGALLSSVEAPFAILAKKKGIILSFEIEPSALGRYVGDPVRVRQILYNLVSNGVKFTQDGEVTLQASRQGDSLTIVISDTGPGIPTDRLDIMFDKFTQGDATTTRKFGGTGLGLAICRELCHLMAGEIKVESELGRGSVFTVFLKLPWLGRPIDAPTPEDLSPLLETLQEIQILAAEDNGVNQLVLKTLLNQMGLDPAFVGDGLLAVEAWENREWDLILMDVQMPNMNGIDACKAIREKELQSGRRRTPIIALTADAMSHQTDQYKSAGMDGFVPKPIGAKSLLEEISKFI